MKKLLPRPIPRAAARNMLFSADAADVSLINSITFAGIFQSRHIIFLPGTKNLHIIFFPRRQKRTAETKKSKNHLDKPARVSYNSKVNGLVAQLGERRVRNAEVKGSSPSRSTSPEDREAMNRKKAGIILFLCRTMCFRF